MLASGTNSSCSVLSPITLPSWEHVAHIAEELSDSGFDVAFGEGDETDAYKKQPILPAHAFYRLSHYRARMAGGLDLRRLLSFLAQSRRLFITTLFRAY